MRVPQEQVPIEFRRKAIQHLESIRGTPLAPPGTEWAQIVGEVCPIYRPDIEGIAYWEFELDVASEAAPRVMTTTAALATPELANMLQQPTAERAAPAGRPASEGRGFIIVSTGEHDFPIPHWSLQRPPVSHQLEMEAQEAGATIARIYKLDALAYVAENEAGEEVARSGQTPVPIEGLGHNLGRRAGEISSLTAGPERGADEGNPKGIRHAVKRTGSKPPEIRAADPERWPQLKERYADVFGPFLDMLRRRAERPWKVDKLVAEFGEGVIAGESFSIGLLRPDAVIEVTGEGADLVDLEMDEKPGRRPRVRARPRRSPHGRETDFQVRIRYLNGEEETLRYFIVSRETPSNIRAQRQLRGELGGELE